MRAAIPLTLSLGCGSRQPPTPVEVRTPTTPTPYRAEANRELDAAIARRRPAADDWETEVLHEQLAAALKSLGQQLHEPSDSVTELPAVPSFSCSELRPTALDSVFDDGTLQVRRWRPGVVREVPTVYEGATGLRRALASLAEPFHPASPPRVAFKIVSVDVRGTALETTAFFQASGRGSAGALQQHATWHCRWQVHEDDWRLARIILEEYEEVRAAGGPLFEDCTQSVVGHNRSFQEQLCHGTSYWRARLQASLGVDLLGHQGLAIGDANGDGLDDLYVCQPGGLPNRLFLQQPDGTAVDVSAAWGVDLLDRTRSGLFLDLDNDGDQDLTLVTDTRLATLENHEGRYRPLGSLLVGTSTSLAAADFDQDGDLDLYVCGYAAPTGGDSAPVPYHDANNGHRNTLLRNDGAGNFSDATREAGLESNNQRFSLAAAWEDFDNDGDQDLYVANDFGRNNLYRNDGGRFVDVAASAGVEDISAGMGVTWGDYNQDGWPDIYVSNMFSSAGHRIAYQRRFRSEDSVGTRALFRRHARGNSLFENTGEGTFRDVSEEARVTLGRWAWASLFADLNNDGRQDLLVTNGLVTNEQTDDL